MEKMAVYERYSQVIPTSLTYELIDFLKYRNIEFIVAPYEADSQLAYLLHSNYVDYIMSEDSDMIAYNCFKIIKGYKIDGRCDVLYPSTAKEKAAGDIEIFDEFMSFSKFISRR